MSSWKRLNHSNPSGCGKTVFTKKLLFDNPELLGAEHKKIHYCYGSWQDSFLPMKNKGVTFHEGIPPHTALRKWFPNQQGGVLILDDLMDEGSNEKEVLDLFTKHSHHLNITVMYLCQDLFPKGKFAKTISRNAHYVVVFKNPRDQVGLRNLLQQAWPNNFSDVLTMFQKLTDGRPFSYMLLDFHPSSKDNERVKSHLLKDEGFMRKYHFAKKN